MTVTHDVQPPRDTAERGVDKEGRVLVNSGTDWPSRGERATRRRFGRLRARCVGLRRVRQRGKQNAQTVIGSARLEEYSRTASPECSVQRRGFRT